MTVVMLLMIATGIGAAQAVTDPRQVTLRWLRLGGIVALCLIAVAETISWTAGVDAGSIPVVVGAVALPFAAQLLAVQTGRRRFQRVLAAAGGTLGASAVCLLLVRQAVAFGGDVLQPRALSAATLAGTVGVGFLGSGLAGGVLMTMLLGHAYLTAGHEMTQRPFARLVGVTAVLLVARLALSLLLGLRPYRSAAGVSLPPPGAWEAAMLAARYLVGIVVPGVFLYMTYDCVKRRANQSATGILYVTAVLVLLGEGIALGLLHTTGLPF